MNSRILPLTLMTLIAGSAALTSTAAFADRGFYKQHQSESQSTKDSRDSGREPSRQSQEKQLKQHSDRTRRSGSPAADRVERQGRHGIEMKLPTQTVRRTKRVVTSRYGDSTARKVVQHVRDDRTERGNRNVRSSPHSSAHRPTYDRGRRAVSSRRHIETHRSFHIERPHRIIRPHNYRPVVRNRYYLGIHVYRPYGYLYPGFGFYYSDNDAFRWLAFTALTLTIIHELDEHQQRMHEQALIRATTGEEGDTLYWDDRNASGSVTVLYIGTDSRGREYREFRQTISTHGRTETSYGSATLKSNGSWQVSKLS